MVVVDVELKGTVAVMVEVLIVRSWVKVEVTVL